ncbi:MAG: winged helix-turn-helix domain-containing protein [Candidatus Lokiarchaeia archaeon]
MITKIGIIAGDILNLLDEERELTLSEICDSLEHQKDHILMSIGWLAREGYIIVKEENGDYKVSLRKAE